MFRAYSRPLNLHCSFVEQIIIICKEMRILLQNVAFVAEGWIRCAFRRTHAEQTRRWLNPCLENRAHHKSKISFVSVQMNR